MDFAKLCHPDKKNFDSIESALRFLEKKFKVPYDQTGLGDVGRDVFGLNAKNHHFKSLAHNPSLLGLFFSILDQFTNSSHFITDGQLISLYQADEKWELQGGNILSKLFCGFVNWFGASCFGCGWIAIQRQRWKSWNRNTVSFVDMD